MGGAGIRRCFNYQRNWLFLKIDLHAGNKQKEGGDERDKEFQVRKCAIPKFLKSLRVQKVNHSLLDEKTYSA